jgi:hypothetical protein
MPIPKESNKQLETALSGYAKRAPLPSSGPKFHEKDILAQIRVSKFIDAKQTRKLIMSAFRNKCLYLCIGIPPGSPRGEDEDTKSPDYFYEGDDLMELEYMLETPNTILECSATLIYGDGGISVETDEHAAHAYKIIEDKYREPTLYLHF